MLEINSNGSKWYGQEPDTIEELLEVLEKHALDPAFEKYGNFVNNNPQWIKPEAEEKYKGCTQIFGNFAKYSNVFNIITDDKNIIDALTKAINKNKQTEEYKQIKKEYLAKDKRKAEAIKLFNHDKISMLEMYQ